jgi:uncharacterized protein YcaQ
MTPPVTRLQGLDSLSPLPAGAGRLMPPMHNADHEAPFGEYVRAMARELEANRHKGDRTGWLAQDPRVLVSEVLYHAAKLSYALRQFQQGDGPPERVLEFAADVGNTALMVADAAGVLVPEEAAA